MKQSKPGHACLQELISADNLGMFKGTLVGRTTSWPSDACLSHVNCMANARFAFQVGNWAEDFAPFVSACIRRTQGSKTELQTMNIHSRWLLWKPFGIKLCRGEGAEILGEGWETEKGSVKCISNECWSVEKEDQNLRGSKPRATQRWSQMVIQSQ
jgi:hypothetical protein